MKERKKEKKKTKKREDPDLQLVELCVNFTEFRIVLVNFVVDL